MEKLFLNILSLSLSGAVIGGILILLHPLTRKHFSKKWNYYIWLILAIRLIIPAGFGFSPFHISYPFSNEGNIVAAEELENGKTAELGMKGTEDGGGVENVAVGEAVESPDTVERLDDVPRMEIPFAEQRNFRISGRIVYALGVLWLFGALVAFFTKLVRYRQLIKRTKDSCRPVTDGEVIVTANIVALRLNLQTNVSIYESLQVPGPVTMGLFKPFVVLPVEERRIGDTALIFHHELLHIKRKDLWYKWLWQLILCIHWFNPVLYKIQEILSEDCELSCDEQILKHLSDNGKRAYGNVLLDTAQKNLDFGETVFLTTLLEEKKALKERLKGIIEYKKQSGLKVIASLCVMVMVMSLSACGTIIISGDAAGVSGNSAYATEDDEWSFWDIFKMDEDDFLKNFPKKFDESGEAYCTYDSDEMIAGVDRNDLWMAYYYNGGDRIKCRGFGFNGSDSIYIIYAKEDTTVEISSEFEIAEGKFKIVYVAPDCSVSVLNETGDSNTVGVQLKKGRNVIKMVGRAARIKNLEVSHSTLDKEAVENIYYSPEDEYADCVLDDIRQGNIDKEKIWETLCYMDDKTVSEALKELCKQGVTLTKDELEDIFIYGDEKLTGHYLAEAIRNKEIQPLNGEMIRSIMYYMDSDTLAELIMTMDKKELTFDVLTDCIYYLDEKEADSCVMYYMELGNQLTYSQYTRISNWLSEAMRKKIESEMKL
ncbi:MAG: hypothetical protein HDR00_06585 [Lachnospiraceae bacterium]|nr:hypothetical protein [Lachnospiraceae bacterium]